MCAGGRSGGSGMNGSLPNPNINPYWNADNPAMYRGQDYTHSELVPNRDYDPARDPNLTKRVEWQARPEFVARDAPPDVEVPNTTGAWWNRPGRAPGATQETVANPNFQAGDTRGIRWGNPETITRPVAWPYDQAAKKKLGTPAAVPQAVPGERVLSRT